jgi:hypothetical protein
MGENKMELKLVQQIQIGLNQKALDEWVDYRRKYSKKAMSQPAVDRVIRKLLQWSEFDQMRLVDEAIEREWTSINWVDPPKKQSSRQSDIYSELQTRVGLTNETMQRL